MKIIKTEPPELLERIHIDFKTESRESAAIRKIEESIAYMMRHVDMPLQAATLVARANVSQSHFFTLFKRYVGYTPIDFFIRLRLQRACHLLEGTEMSVKAIAYALGYDDPFYFSRVFKSFNRIAPSKYRRLKLRPNKTVKDRKSMPCFSASCRWKQTSTCNG